MVSKLNVSQTCALAAEKLLYCWDALGRSREVKLPLYSALVSPHPRIPCPVLGSPLQETWRESKEVPWKPLRSWSISPMSKGWQLGLFSSEKTKLRGISPVCTNNHRERAKRIGPGSFQWYPVTRTGLMGMKWNAGVSLWTSETTCSQWGWLSTGTGCLGTVWSLTHWRYSKAVWIRPWTTNSRWLCFAGALGEVISRGPFQCQLWSSLSKCFKWKLTCRFKIHWKTYLWSRANSQHSIGDFYDFHYCAWENAVISWNVTE